MRIKPSLNANTHALLRKTTWPHFFALLPRINVLLQNYSTMSAQAIRQQGVFVEPIGDERTSFVDARDVAAVAAAALTEVGHAGHAYTLTGGVAHTRAEVAAAIAQTIGKPVRYQALSDAEFRALANSLGWADDFVSMMLGFIILTSVRVVQPLLQIP